VHDLKDRASYVRYRTEHAFCDADNYRNEKRPLKDGPRVDRDRFEGGWKQFSNLARAPEGSWLSEIATRRSKMSIGMILLIVLVLALLGVIPTWGHSSNWGYGPSGGIGLVLLIVLILVLLGKI
jgi:hypothetical protein